MVPSRAEAVRAVSRGLRLVTFPSFELGSKDAAFSTTGFRTGGCVADKFNGSSLQDEVNGVLPNPKPLHTP